MGKKGRYFSGRCAGKEEHGAYGWWARDGLCLEVEGCRGRR